MRIFLSTGEPSGDLHAANLIHSLRRLRPEVEVVGFGGLDEVRFRDPVFPGQRLIIAIQLLKVRRGAMIVCRFQGFVNQNLVVEGKIRGIPLPIDLPTV